MDRIIGERCPCHFGNNSARRLFSHKITLTAIPFTLIGLPLAIFLGFRNSAAYDRYSEGRKLWGEIVLQSRNFARQCLTLIEHTEPLKPRLELSDVRVRMIYPLSLSPTHCAICCVALMLPPRSNRC